MPERRERVNMDWVKQLKADIREETKVVADMCWAWSKVGRQRERPAEAPPVHIEDRCMETLLENVLETPHKAITKVRMGRKKKYLIHRNRT